MGQVLSYISNIWRCIHSIGHNQLSNSEQPSHYITIPDSRGGARGGQQGRRPPPRVGVFRKLWLYFSKIFRVYFKIGVVHPPFRQILAPPLHELVRDGDDMTWRAPEIPELEGDDQLSYYITIPDGYISDGDMTLRAPETVTLPALCVRPSVTVVYLRNADELEVEPEKEVVEVEKEVIVSEVVLAQPFCNTIQRIGPYNSHQSILLVGEGDFSFSVSLAVAFGNASNIIATSLNSQEYLIKNYRKFLNNKMKLETRGCMVIHGVDATNIVQHSLLGNLRFDCIIYNFPHTGSFGRTDSDLRKNRELVMGFLRNAKKMVNENGEIHITHKSNGFFRGWDIPKIGCGQGLYLTQEIRFNRKLYCGYQTKFGFRGDKNFHCSPSKTYVFATHPVILNR